MTIAAHSTAAFRILAWLWAGGYAVSPAPAARKIASGERLGGSALVYAVLAGGIDARTPGAGFGCVEDVARSLGVDSSTAGRWVRRFGRALANAVDAAGAVGGVHDAHDSEHSWDGLATLLCNMDPDVAESEADAWPRVRGVLTSAGFGVAAVMLAMDKPEGRTDARLVRAVLLVCARRTSTDAARACGVNQPAVWKAHQRVRRNVEMACTNEARNAERSGVVDEVLRIGSENTTRLAEPAVLLVRLLENGLALAGRLTADSLSEGREPAADERCVKEGSVSE